MVEQQALAQTEDEMNLLTLRVENIGERFNKLEAEVSPKIIANQVLAIVSKCYQRFL